MNSYSEILDFLLKKDISTVFLPFLGIRNCAVLNLCSKKYSKNQIILEYKEKSLKIKQEKINKRYFCQPKIYQIGNFKEQVSSEKWEKIIYLSKLIDSSCDNSLKNELLYESVAELLHKNNVHYGDIIDFIYGRTILGKKKLIKFSYCQHTLSHGFHNAKIADFEPGRHYCPRRDIYPDKCFIKFYLDQEYVEQIRKSYNPETDSSSIRIN